VLVEKTPQLGPTVSPIDPELLEAQWTQQV
jgi:hypothetical protein